MKNTELILKKNNTDNVYVVQLSEKLCKKNVGFGTSIDPSG